MGRSRKEDVQIEHRRTQVADLFTKGWTQVAIAGELGVSQATISTDVKAIRQEWSEARIEDVGAAVALELKRTEVLHRETCLAWVRSQQPVETIRIIDRNGQKLVEKTVQERPGDPRFLQIAHRAIKIRFRLLGLDAAVSDKLDQEAIDCQVNQRFWAFFQLTVENKLPGPDVVDDAYIEQLVASFGDRKPMPAVNEKPWKKLPALPKDDARLEGCPDHEPNSED